MVTRRWSGIVVSLLVLAVVVAGCAKRPATSTVAAPAPTGTGGSMGGGGGTTGGPGSTAGGGTAGTGATTGLQPGTTGPGTTGAGTAARPTPKEFAAVPDLVDIHFDFDKYDIRPGDAKVLDSNASWLKSNPAQLVLIEGHCDERGTNEYNLALGERRAKAAMNYLVSQGVQASRITIISYGEERPLCSEHNESCWTRNRRAHFLVKPR
jgi:peptidoglycan-associated lipoprotein